MASERLKGKNGSKIVPPSAKQNTTREQRKANTIDGTRAIGYIKRIVDTLRPWELSPSERFKTYWTMLGDDAVWSSVSSRVSAIETSQSRSRLKYDKNSPRSKELYTFLSWNLHNMDRTTRSVGRDAAEMVYNGCAPFEVVTQYAPESSPYKNMFVLKDLIYIDPLTIDPVRPFTTKNSGREMVNLRQKVSAFKDYGNSSFSNAFKMESGAVEIDWRKIGLCSYAANSGRPLGMSDLDAAYTAWREKILIQDYLLMGIQKDLAGTPVLRVPQQLFDDAQADPSSMAAVTLNQLQQHMSNLHAGDQTFVILPSDTYNDSGTGAMLYDINFKGVDGSSKMFDLVEIIEQKKKAIYTVLGASHLITGESGSGGSYNLLEGKADQAAHLAERDSIIIDEMWNKKVIPLILKLNGFTNELPSDIPVYQHGEVQPISLDEKGKYINRVARLLPAVPDVVNELLSDMGIDYRVKEDATEDDIREMLFTFEDVSKVGEGEGSSGTGSSQDGGGSSDTNSENAS